MRLSEDTDVHFEVRVTLSEEEAKALVGLGVYGIDAFLRVFYEHLGECYLRPHEPGIRSLFTTVSDKLVPALARVTDARRVLASEKGSVSK